MALFGHLPQALSVAFQKIKSYFQHLRQVGGVLGSWLILQYAAHTLSLLDRRKGRHNIPLALCDANFFPPPFFFPSLLFYDIYLAGQKVTYSLPFGTSNHTPPPQYISVTPS